MNPVSLIEHKRDGGELSTEQIQFFVRGLVAGQIADYQTAAMLMAIYWRGLNRRETVDLTMAMAHSGDTLDLHDVADFVIDKHSSGGVGDKTTLVVQPMVAACGVPVGKMSGRGLGITGGTLDKMESIAGWSPKLTTEQFKNQLREIGIVLAGQSADLAPADGILYSLRDVTATVGSIPLIAASIMSKKLAGGADGIVLDVKYGSGAFMKTRADAQKLADTMVAIGTDAERKTVAILSDMNQPLGYAIGNALELKEAIAVLNGRYAPADFWQHCLQIAATMLVVAGTVDDLDGAKVMAKEACDSGAALAKFKQMVAAQGGDVAQIDHPDLLPHAAIQNSLLAANSGTIVAIDTGAIGLAAVELGAGRKAKGEPIDHAVGFDLRVKVGDRVERGDQIGVVFGAVEERVESAEDALQNAISIEL
jgi:pyrimidine-nucleoside phosphorylase